jgi:inhibitor of KinA
VREHTIPVCYETAFAPDLEVVAAHAGLSCDEVVQLHVTGVYTVRAVGFSPGFPYLCGLAPALHTPRRATPRTVVPAGSVGVGGAQTGIYALETPGGWNLIGRTPLKIFDAASAAPALFRVGDHVRFQTITGAAFGSWSA